jgi:small conductance mechanosensitive channel
MMRALVTDFQILFQEGENGSATTDSGTGEPCENLGLLCEWLFEATGNERLSEILSWVLGTPLRILLILIVAVTLNKWLRRKITDSADKLEMISEDHDEQLATDRSVERAKERADTLSSFARSAISAIIYGAAGIMILEVIGFGVVTAIAGAGIAGLMIAFGAQSVVEDILKGFFMIIEDQFGVGDRIDVGSVEGFVERVTLRTTVIRDPDGRIWYVPNSEIARVRNETQHWSRSRLEIGVSYASDLRQASEVIAQTAQSLAEEDEWKDHIQEAPDLKGVQSLGDDAVLLLVDTRLAPDQRRGFERALWQRLKEALDEAGIEMPNRQLDVWMRGRPDSA